MTCASPQSTWASCPGSNSKGRKVAGRLLALRQRTAYMTLLGNFVRTREQGEQRMYWRSMNGMRSSSRTHSFLMKTLILASHASSAPFVPFERIMFFLSGHLYKISQQSHKGPPIHSPPPSPLRMVMGLSLG